MGLCDDFSAERKRGSRAGPVALACGSRRLGVVRAQPAANPVLSPRVRSTCDGCCGVAGKEERCPAPLSEPQALRRAGVMAEGSSGFGLLRLVGSRAARDLGFSRLSLSWKRSDR